MGSTTAKHKQRSLKIKPLAPIIISSLYVIVNEKVKFFLHPLNLLPSHSQARYSHNSLLVIGVVLGIFISSRVCHCETAESSLPLSARFWKE